MIYPFLDEHIDADIGVKDRDGVEIYEHDIVEGGLFDPTDPELYFVIYSLQNCGFVLVPIEYLESYKKGKFPEVVFAIQSKFVPFLKVIGTIYDRELNAESSFVKC